MDSEFLFSLFIFMLRHIIIYYWSTTSHIKNVTQTCIKICWGGGAGSPGVKEMLGETKHMEQLMDHSLWNIYMYILKKNHEDTSTNWQMYCYLYTCTVVWWRYADPISLSLQTTTTPATGRPWGSVWQWAAYARTLGWGHEKNTAG